MATIAAPTVRISKPPSIVAAVAIAALLALVGNAVVLFWGPGDIEVASVIICTVSAVLHLVAAWGLWNLRRWGVIFTAVLTVIDILTSLPLFADSSGSLYDITIAAFIVLEIGILILLALPASRFVFQREAH